MESPICPDAIQPIIKPAICIEVKVGLIHDRSHTRSNCGVGREEVKSVAGIDDVERKVVMAIREILFD